MMPARQYNNVESTTTLPTSTVTYPIGEYYSYYPTWCDYSKETTTPVTYPTVTPTTTSTIFNGVDEVVISGLSGRFPESENVEEFSRQLYGTTGGLFEQQQQRKPQQQWTGLFDYGFFGLTEQQAQLMEPQLRVLLEVTYESIFDSGFNPMELKGTKTGVFIGTTGVYNNNYYPVEPTTGVYGGEFSQQQYAAEIAKYFEFVGPTYTIDTTQSSGLVALDSAINAIRAGMCSQAIVGGINLTRQQFYERYGNVSGEVYPTFNGSVGIVFLQKRGVARRFYATVVNSKSIATPINGEKEFNFTYQNGEQFYKLLREVYGESNIDPNMVSYLETNCGGDKLVDENEYKVIYDIFGKNRNVPLFVGSTKSTAGYEHGIISLVKMLISTQRGMIPASLKFQQPTTQQTAYGGLKFLTENTRFNGGLMALNSFGYRGTSVHIVLQPNNEQVMGKYGQELFWNRKDLMNTYTTQPRLFHFSARTEEGLLNVLEQMHQDPTDLATHLLLNANAFTSPITHPYRGYTVLNSTKKIREFKKLTGEKRPLYFLFNGLGAQWTGMGKELMQIEYFAQSINRIADILKQFGFDFFTYFNGEERVQYEHPFYSTILITAIQVAFVDLIKYLGVQPDGIIGYSFGELVAAYADNALTFEETILSAYYLGRLIKESSLPEGAMAKVGLSWEEALRQCPQTIVPTFYETRDTVIVSGPRQAIQQFIQQLKSLGIYASEVESYGLGLHSYLMTPIASQYKQKLESIICTPKLRSSKWFTTIVPPKTTVEGELYKYASPEYFVNCMFNPVYLYETIKRIPTNAITIEFGPSVFLQPILTRVLGDNYTYINFMKRDVQSHLEHFWYNFGRLYNEGINVDAMKLFVPSTKFQQVYPVPHTTKFLSPMVSWFRSNGKPYIPRYEQFELPRVPTMPVNFLPQQQQPGLYTFNLDLTNGSEYSYLNGHQIYGKVTYPTSGYLYLVWNALAQMRNVQYTQLPVVFEDIQFFHPTVFEEPRVTMIVRFVDIKTGRFEVVYNAKVIVSGRIYVPQETSMIGWQGYNQSEWLRTTRTDLLEQEEIYRDLKLRGYEYNNIFKGIRRSSIDGTRGELFWYGKWISFLESMIQMHMIGKTGLTYPTQIHSIRIDPRMHGRYINTIDENNNMEYMSTQQQQPIGMLPVTFDKYTQTYVAGGVEMSGLYTTALPSTFTNEQPMVLERVNFVPYFERYGLGDFVENGAECEFGKPNFEYIDSYINEVKYYISEILRKIEHVPQTYTGIKSTSSLYTIPTTSSYDSLSSYANIRSYTPTPAGGKSMIEGKFLQLLKEIYSIEFDSQYVNKVKQFLGGDLSLYKSWNEDPVFYFQGGRYTYLKSLLDTVYENVINYGTQTLPTMKVLEIAPQFHSFGTKINEFLGMHPSVTVDYHYVPVGEIHPELIAKWRQQYPQHQITKVEWNLRTQELPTPCAQYKDYDLVIFNGSIASLPFFEDKMMMKRWLQTVSEKLVKPQGFFLVHEYINHFETLNQLGQFEQFLSNGGLYKTPYTPYKYQQEAQWRQLFDGLFHPIALKHDNVLSSFFLYRKPFAYPTTNYGQRMTHEIEIPITNVTSFDWIERVKQALVQPTYERIWLIVDNMYTSGMIGLVNCLRHEPRGDRIRCVFIAGPSVIGEQWRDQLENIKRGDLVMNVFKYGKWGSYRNLFDMHEMEQPMHYNNNTQYAYVDWLKRGDLSTLQWMQSPTPVVKDLNQLLINVSYAGLGQRDCMIASGLVHPENMPTYPMHKDNVFGMEFSGYAKDNNRRYMGITSGRGLSTVLVGDKRYVWEVPQQWSLEQASTVPVSYAQAYYALVVRGGLKSGESVLIHNGATPFGQAAISIALGFNCKVFTTITSAQESELLMQLFPGKLFDESFVYLNDEYFDRQIFRYTQGTGVNVVLNGLYAGERLPSLVRSLAPYGRFLEINDYHFVQQPTSEFVRPTSFNNTLYNKNVSYHTIMFDTLFDLQNYNEWQKVYELIQEGIHAGIVRPLRSTVYDRYQIQDAFKHLCEYNKPISKILVKVWEPKERVLQPTMIKALPKLWFTPCSTYIITAGLTTFGLELAHFLVERGVRKLMLTSRAGLLTGYQQRKLQYLQETYGAIIKVSHYDVQKENECVFLLKEATDLSEDKRIGGVFHLQTAFVDAAFEQITPEHFKRLMSTKYLGAYNLDKFIHEPECYFVVFSSMVSGRGYPGSTVYGYVNSSVERLCELRRLEGKHAIAIQWGPIGEIESVFETPESERIYNGTQPQRVSSTLKTLEHILLRGQYNTIWSSYVPQQRQSQLRKPFVDIVAQGEEYKYNSRQQYKSIEIPQPTEFIYSTIFQAVFQLLGINDYSNVRFNVPLVNLGLTIELAGELKSMLKKYYDVYLPISEIQQLTFENLKSFEYKYRQPCTGVYNMPTAPRGVSTINGGKYNYLMPKTFFEKLNDIEVTQKMYPLIVVHPIEGHVSMLKNWARHMKYPVYGIQYTSEALPYDSIEKLADYYLNKIDCEFGVQTRFHLVGYSFGGSVAFEMASKNSGRIASLSFLDGSYMYVNPLINSFKSKYLSKEMPVIESEFLYGFVSQYTQIPSRQCFVSELSLLPTFVERIAYTISQLIKLVPVFKFDSFDLEQAARSYVQRMFMSYKYQPKSVLKYNEILLVKPTQKTAYSELFGEDYGLGTWIQGKIRMQMIESDQRSFLESNNGLKVATILNEYLSKYYF